VDRGKGVWTAGEKGAGCLLQRWLGGKHKGVIWSRIFWHVWAQHWSVTAERRELAASLGSSLWIALMGGFVGCS